MDTLHRRKIDLCCAQETRWKGESARMLGAIGRRYKFFWQGCNKATAGVGVFIAERWIVKNGVKQGGVISPILFNLYIDRLLLCLQRSGSGCHISNTYMGALSYADDITLINPSLYGLNRMLDICNKFAIDNFTIFNSKKTICLSMEKMLESRSRFL